MQLNHFLNCTTNDKNFIISNPTLIVLAKILFDFFETAHGSIPLGKVTLWRLTDPYQRHLRSAAVLKYRMLPTLSPTIWNARWKISLHQIEMSITIGDSPPLIHQLNWQNVFKTLWFVSQTSTDQYLNNLIRETFTCVRIEKWKKEK